MPLLEAELPRFYRDDSRRSRSCRVPRHSGCRDGTECSQGKSRSTAVISASSVIATKKAPPVDRLSESMSLDDPMAKSPLRKQSHSDSVRRMRQSTPDRKATFSKSAPRVNPGQLRPVQPRWSSQPKRLPPVDRLSESMSLDDPITKNPPPKQIPRDSIPRMRLSTPDRKATSHKSAPE